MESIVVIFVKVIIFIYYIYIYNDDLYNKYILHFYYFVYLFYHDLLLRQCHFFVLIQCIIISCKLVYTCEKTLCAVDSGQLREINYLVTEIYIYFSACVHKNITNRKIQTI